jgi:ParB/RepB/Spo0J family partition protein
MAESLLAGLVVSGQAGVSVCEVDLERVDPPDAQLRIDLDPVRLAELARSIASEGLLHLPVVRRRGDRFVVVAGHRRTEACRSLGWRRMTAVVREGGGSNDLATAAHENLFRHDLSAVEEAGAVAAMIESVGGDVDEAARRINRTRGWIDSRLRILAWPGDVQQAVHRGELAAGAGAELAAVTDDVHRAFLLEHAVRGGATARTCQAWRIAWEQTGVVSTASVAQVAVGGTPPAPVEAELPCMVCGDRQPFSRLTHVWVCAEGLAVLQEVARMIQGGQAFGGEFAGAEGEVAGGVVGRGGGPVR